ncbi:MAG: 5-deoxy-glucuronate isomerase [Bacillota bacterium]|nr:5-deoxy-glucuronate isomerase [Bacillota bacterium]
MLIDTTFPNGLTTITDLDRPVPGFGIRFSVLRLAESQLYRQTTDLEYAYLLIRGSASMTWNGEQEVTVSRKNCFDEKPWVLHVPSGCPVQIRGLSNDCELAIQAAVNPVRIQPLLYAPDDVREEARGKGTMGETSTRLVRTVFDVSNAPEARLVLGEVVTFPGKWSSYPPHHHSQPEIYHYRFAPDCGYGHCELGDQVVKVRHNSTVLISPDLVHPQAAAPGYAMWYLWVIRHLPDNHYINPTFLPEHTWVSGSDAAIWPNRSVD